MVFTIEELIIPPRIDTLAFVNFSRKSYAFSYISLAQNKFVFEDGVEWTGRGHYGPTAIKQRGFVIGAFSKPV